MNLYCGIDPGKNGGFSFINADTGEATSYLWDDTRFVRKLRAFVEDDSRVICACVEKVSAMPGQGVTSMFKFGQSFGFILGVLSAFEIPFQLVPPQRWKKEYSLGSDKQASIEACQRLFPDVNLIPAGHRKPQDGMAESLLLAEYGKRHF